jgi:anti-sigma-K factor RskA
VSRRDRRGEWLHAWADGELRGLRARRAARAVERSEEARREVEEARRVGSWVRESMAADEGGPDAWPGIAARLPSLDAAREAEPRGLWLLRPLVASATLAAAVMALVVGLLLEPQDGVGDVVQWLDSEGAPVMVLEGEGDTIIWMLSPAAEDVSRSALRVST